MAKLTEVIVAGAGRIGSLISHLLANSEEYKVFLADLNPPPKDSMTQANISFFQCDITQTEQLQKFIKKTKSQAIISCLPYYFNLDLATLASKMGLNYFDLTEDVKIREQVKNLAKNQHTSFTPSCGLAPGFINIVAADLIGHFAEVKEVKLRVGCIPFLTDNSLRYALTWSTEGIINQYGNPCQALVDGTLAELNPLENLETIIIDGTTYEAFNTSGGIGSLVETYQGKVRNLNYKTIRYPGHCEKMKFLMQDLKLNDNRGMLKQILENVLPEIRNDVTILYVTVEGEKDGHYTQELYLNKFYPQKLFNRQWTSIQMTTASSACAVIDIVLKQQNRYQGFVAQENISLQEFLKNPFGKLFQHGDLIT